jgi:hypothetical protein
MPQLWLLRQGLRLAMLSRGAADTSCCAAKGEVGGGLAPGVTRWLSGAAGVLPADAVKGLVGADV